MVEGWGMSSVHDSIWYIYIYVCIYVYNIIYIPQAWYIQQTRAFSLPLLSIFSGIYLRQCLFMNEKPG